MNYVATQILFSSHGVRSSVTVGLRKVHAAAQIAWICTLVGGWEY